MQTPTTAIMTINLGKFSSVLCWFQAELRLATFRTVKRTPEEHRGELTRQSVALVVFEACSQAGWTLDLCEEPKLSALVANTNGVAWQWKHVKRKTDRDEHAGSDRWAEQLHRVVRPRREWEPSPPPGPPLPGPFRGRNRRDRTPLHLISKQ